MSGHNRLLSPLIVFLLLLLLCQSRILTVSGQSSSEQIRSARQRPGHRFAKALNKEEGAIRLVGGRNEFEGNFLTKLLDSPRSLENLQISPQFSEILENFPCKIKKIFKKNESDFPSFPLSQRKLNQFF